MGNRDIDKLFKEGLEQEMTFSGQERQWEAVAEKLKADTNDRGGVWLWISLGVLLLMLIEIAGQFPEKVAPPTVTEMVAEQPAKRNNKPKNNHKQLTAVPSTDDAEGRKPANTFTANSTTVVAPRAVQPIATPAGISQQKENPSLLLANGSGPLRLDLSAASGSVQSKDKMVAGNDFTYHYYLQKKRQNADQLLPLHRSASDQVPLLLTELALLSSNNDAPSVELPGVREGRSSVNWLSLHAGLRKDWIRDTQLVNKSEAVVYLGANLKLSKRWGLSLTYSKEAVERAIKSSPAAYQVPVLSPPTEPAELRMTRLEYQLQQLDVGLDFRFASIAKINFKGLGGVRLSRTSDIEASYIYNNVYEQLVVEEVLDPQGIHLSDLFAGLQLDYPLNNRLSIQSRYQIHIPLSSKMFRWTNQHRLHLGLGYHF